MGVYINGMEMPRRGMVVNIYGDGRVTNHFDKFGKTIGKAVPVPPHGDLIEKKKLSDDLQRRWNVSDDQDFCNKEVWRAIEEAPTIIAAEEEAWKN